MSAKQVVNYSTRDYSGVVSQIESDPDLKEQPTRWKRLIAGVFDVLNNTINAVANALLLRTAYDRTILQDTLALIGYDLRWKQTSQALLTVTIQASATASSSYTINASDIVGSTAGTTSKPPLRFEARNSLTFSIGTTVSSILVYQQTTVPSQVIGVTDGSDWQMVDLPDSDVLRETLVVQIGVDLYTRVSSFGKSSNTDKHYKLYYRSDGSSYIKFGGIDAQTSLQYGYKASAGQNVAVSYATGGGVDSGTFANTITQYIGANANVVSINNASDSTGGINEESISNAIELAPLSLRAVSGQFTNESSGRSIALGIDGVLDVQIIKTGLLSVDVCVLPVGGGLPSTTVKDAVTVALTKASLLEEVKVAVIDPTYITTNVTALLKVLSGYNASKVIAYVKFAIVYRISEIGKSIYQTYDSNGVSSVISQINTLYSAIIGATFNVLEDGAQIERILINGEYQIVGRNLLIEDLAIACANVYGVDYIKFTNPASEIVVSSGALIKPSTITITQI